MLDFIFKRNKKICSIMITKTGRIDINNRYPDDSTFNYNSGEYIINKNTRMLRKNTPVYIHLEGVPDALNFTGLEKPSDLKIDSIGLKAVLKAKLFYELFMDKNQNLKEILTYILLGIAVLGIIYIAIQLNDHKKLLQVIISNGNPAAVVV